MVLLGIQTAEALFFSLYCQILGKKPKDQKEESMCGFWTLISSKIIFILLLNNLALQGPIDYED